MTYLVDSDRVADYLKGRGDAVELVDSLRPDGLAISIVTYAEIYDGVYHGRDPRAAETAFRLFLRSIPVLGINRPVTRRFATIRGGLRKAGFTVGDFDLLIAATCIEHRLTLVTRNRTDFERVPGLTLHRE